MPVMCETCKCSQWLDKESGKYLSDCECSCCEHFESQLNYCNACHLLQHNSPTECPVFSYEVPTLNGILTLGQLREMTKHLPDDTQITTAGDNDYFNVSSVELPDFDERFSVILITADTFDPRQF